MKRLLFSQKYHALETAPSKATFWSILNSAEATNKTTSALTKEKNGPVIARFSLSQRSNIYIEILRIVLLFLLVFFHSAHISRTNISPFFQYILGVTSHYGANGFIVITAIFTIGKGKNYFLRNLSRLIFVLVTIWAIGLPLYYNANTNSGVFHYSMWRFIFGGRDIWYLYALCLASLLFPLIKIDKLLGKNLLISAFLGVLIIVVASSLNNSPINVGGLIILFNGIGAYFLHFSYYHWTYKRKKIFLSVTMLGLGILAWTLNYWEEHLHIRDLLTVFHSLVITLFVIWLITFQTKPSKVVSVVVRNSYYIYELHFIFQIVWQVILVHIGHTNADGKVFFKNDAWLIISTIFVLVCSLISSVIASKVHYYIWEPIFGERMLYKIKPNSYLYYVVVVAFLLLLLFFLLRGIWNLY